MAEEKITIRFRDGHRPTVAELGLEGFQLSIEQQKNYFGGPNPGPAEVFETVTIAVIAAGAGVIGAAITGACAYLNGKGAQKIRIKGRTGAEIEFPMNASREQVEAMIKLAVALDNPEIILRTPLPSIEPGQQSVPSSDLCDRSPNENDEWFP
jgi:hypothetical protein